MLGLTGGSFGFFAALGMTGGSFGFFAALGMTGGSFGFFAMLGMTGGVVRILHYARNDRRNRSDSSLHMWLTAR